MLLPVRNGERPPWSHNIAYHPVVRARCAVALRLHTRRRLRERLLVEELADRCTEVVGLDADERALSAATRRLTGHANVRLLRATSSTTTCRSAASSS